MIVFVFALTRDVDCSDIPWMKPSPETLGHLRVPVGLLHSLQKVIISPDVLIHLLEELFVGVLGPTAHPGLPLKVFLGVRRCCRL